MTVLAVQEPQEGGAAPSLLEVLAGRVAQLEASMKERDAREAIMVAPRLRNAISQVLLHACGKQDFRNPSTCFSFEELGVTHPEVQRVAQLMGVMADEVVTHANAVMCRNSAIHPSLQDALDEEVAAVQLCITPALQQLCKWECRFIQAYADIKAAFPDRFGM